MDTALFDADHTSELGLKTPCSLPSLDGVRLGENDDAYEASSANDLALHSNVYPSYGLYDVVYEIRHLLLQSFASNDMRIKSIEGMMSTLQDYRQETSEQIQRNKQLELEVLQLRANLAHTTNALTIERESLGATILRRDETIVDLRKQLSVCQGLNRDLSGCVAKLADAIWDPADLAESGVEARRIKERYEESTVDQARLHQQFQQLKSSYAHLAADSSNKDQLIRQLRAILHDNDIQVAL